MIFNSVTFILFLSLVLMLYWLLPRTIRLWMLLIASCVFYGFWRWEYLSVLFASAITDYFVARAIGATPEENKRKRKGLLMISLVVNLGLLFYFKYLFFITANTNSFLELLNINYNIPVMNVLLPFGISFYTFETISYTVDVYRGLIKPEKSFLNYGLFVTFFPKLVAGPIQRASELLVQLKQKPTFRVAFINDGLKRILYGLFLKVVLADNIAPLVDEGFAANVDTLSAIDVWTLAFLFGFQIYFDFAAYSHIAVGAAKMMGIVIPENFNFPYISSSFKDFWKRWHISLSSWIRDYLYLPLAGVKVARTTGTGGIGEEVTQRKKNIVLFLTWAIMGLWHGANWTFVLWGLYHATLIFFERIIRPYSQKSKIVGSRFVGYFVTLPLVMLSWIPFRAIDLSTAFAMMGKVFIPQKYLFYSFRENTYLIALLMMLLFWISYYATKYIEPILERKTVPGFIINCIKFAILVGFVFTFLRPISQFIYFQF